MADPFHWQMRCDAIINKARSSAGTHNLRDVTLENRADFAPSPLWAARIAFSVFTADRRDVQPSSLDQPARFPSPFLPLSHPSPLPVRKAGHSVASWHGVRNTRKQFIYYSIPCACGGGRRSTVPGRIFPSPSHRHRPRLP